MRIRKSSLLIIFLSILLIIMLFLAFKADSNESPEEKAARIAAWEASKYQEYELTSVQQYIKTETNALGRIINQEPAFCFTYIDNNGQLCSYKDYTYSKYGLKRLVIGDTNKIVIEDGFDTYMYLYLTEETLKNISMIQ